MKRVSKGSLRRELQKLLRQCVDAKGNVLSPAGLARGVEKLAHPTRSSR